MPNVDGERWKPVSLFAGALLLSTTSSGTAFDLQIVHWNDVHARYVLATLGIPASVESLHYVGGERVLFGIKSSVQHNFGIAKISVDCLQVSSDPLC